MARTSSLYQVKIIGETNYGSAVDMEIAILPKEYQAVQVASQVNKLLRDKLHCISFDLLEWRFDIYEYRQDGSMSMRLVGTMDSDNDELKQE